MTTRKSKVHKYKIQRRNAKAGRCIIIDGECIDIGHWKQVDGGQEKALDVYKKGTNDFK